MKIIFGSKHSNIYTNHILSQFYMVFDDLFTIFLVLYKTIRYWMPFFVLFLIITDIDMSGGSMDTWSWLILHHLWMKSCFKSLNVTSKFFFVESMSSN